MSLIGTIRGWIKDKVEIGTAYGIERERQRKEDKENLKSEDKE